MGTTYYLHRADNRTLYELGKAPELGFVFGAADRGHLEHYSSAEVLADRLMHALFSPGAASREGGSYWEDTPQTRAHVRAFAADVVRWSEGQSCSFESEHAAAIERCMEGHPDSVECPWITGSRFRDEVIA